MNCTQMLSLRQIALVKVTVVLWTQNNVLTLIGNFVYPAARRGIILEKSILEKWQKIENQVAVNVPTLLEETLKYKILNLIKSVGLQLLNWMKYCQDLGLKSQPDNLSWTNRGTIDKKKSVSALIEDNSLDITMRYKLACIFCLENDIPQLWSKMTTENKKSFHCIENVRYADHDYLIKFWTYYLEGEVAKLVETFVRRSNCTPYKFAFKWAARGGHIEAIKYFLPKLTLQERDNCLFTYASLSAIFDKGEVLCYLLSEMNVEQQMKVYEIRPYTVLICMLEWPCQDVFLRTADMTRNFLDEKYYNLMLRNIIYKVIVGYRYYDYKKLFRIFWEQSPDAHKEYVINNCNSSTSCLSDLFKEYDKENIKLILKDSPVAVREGIIFHGKKKAICESLIWNLLKFFVQECISSKSSMTKFKEEFKEHSNLLREAVKEEDMWIKFFQLLDDLIQDDGKRSIEDGSSCPSKKLCK